MARSASVSDLDIFTAVKILADDLALDLDAGERPSTYAIRKYLREAAPGEATPSYGLIKNALVELDQLLAAGNAIDELIHDDALVRSANSDDADSDAAERLTTYLSETLRPIAKKLLDDAQALTIGREFDLEMSLDEACRQRDEYQLSARTLSEQLLTHTRAWQQSKDELDTALATIDTLKATVTAQQNELSHLKTIATRDREALERERDHHRTTLDSQRDAATQREHELNNQLRLAREAHAALQNTVATLSADKSALYDQHRSEIQQREALQSICNEQLTAINAADQWRKELLASLDEMREQNNAQTHSIRALQRSEVELRERAETAEAEVKRLTDRVADLTQNEIVLKTNLREAEIQLTSRIREFENLSGLLKESLTARDKLSAAQAVKTQ